MKRAFLIKLFKSIFLLVVVAIFSFWSFFSCVPAFASDQDVIVNEVMYDFPGADTGHEWVELYNNGNDPVTLVGGSGTGSWRISDTSNHTLGTSAIKGSLTIDSHGYLIITQDANTFSSDYPSFSGNLAESSISLSNTSSVVELRIGSSGSPWGTFPYSSSQGGNGDGLTLQKQGNQTLAAAATPGTGNAQASATFTPTQSPTPSPSLTPTKTPTPTPTTKPTATNTPTPTTKLTSTLSPTSKLSSTLTPTHTSSTSSILGESTKSARKKLTQSPTPSVVKTLGVSQTIVPYVFIVLGSISLGVCGILIFLQMKKDEFI